MNNVVAPLFESFTPRTAPRAHLLLHDLPPSLQQPALLERARQAPTTRTPPRLRERKGINATGAVPRPETCPRNRELETGAGVSDERSESPGYSLRRLVIRSGSPLRSSRSPPTQRRSLLTSPRSNNSALLHPHQSRRQTLRGAHPVRRAPNARPSRLVDGLGSVVVRGAGLVDDAETARRERGGR